MPYVMYVSGGIMIPISYCQHIKENRTAIVGTNVTLECNIADPLWVRSKDNAQIAFPQQKNISYKYHLIRTSNERFDLKILNISYEDEDRYCCLGNLKECIYVHVADEPNVPTTDLDIEVCEHSVVSLPCSYLSYPQTPNATHIFWKKDGVPLNFINDRITANTPTNSPLTIKNSSVDDSGLYQCHSVSFTGELQVVTIRLRVKTLLSIISTKDVIETTEDSNITLNCNYESCLTIPISEVFWTKLPVKRKDDFGKTIIQRLVSKPSLVIHKVDVYDSGIYTCHVKAAFYSAIGEDIILLVKEKSKDNNVLGIAAAIGSGIALLLGIFGIAMQALRLHFRREISLNDRHKSTVTNRPGIDESQQSRENTPGESTENDQSINTMINAYYEIDETQMIETTDSSVDARTSILTNTQRRSENTVLTSCPEASARRHENMVLTQSRGSGALDDQNHLKGVEKRKQSMLEPHIVPEQCGQKRVNHNFDNKCFGLNNLQVLEYEEPFTTLKNA